MRKVFLENLKYSKSGRTIRWNDCGGITINFIYDDIEGDIKILNKIPYSDKINIEYNNKNYTVQTDSLLKCEIGYIVVDEVNKKQDKSNFKYHIWDIIKNEASSIKLTNNILIKKKTQTGYYKYYEYKCLKCGYEDKLYESNIVKGYGCPVCSKQKTKENNNKIKFEEVKKYIESLGMELLSEEYTGTHDNLKVKCKCGNIFERALSTFKGTPKREGVTICPNCNGVKINTYESVKQELLYNDIELLDDYYINNKSLMNIKYLNCNHSMSRYYTNIVKSEYKCPKCARAGYNRDTNQLKSEIKEIANNEYELLSEYKTMNDKVLIHHKKCGNKYKTTPHSFLDGGCRCPICGQSKGETIIDNLLNKLNIIHIPQYTYPDLLSKHGKLLRFDFSVLDNNKNVAFLIEYDGEFHYKQLYEEHDLKGQQERDKLKDEYCKLHNIDLLRIPYWEFDNIEDIVLNKLKEKEMVI